jgi:hypothetical protein
MDRKQIVKDPYAEIPPTPLTSWDFVLLLTAFLLIAVASVPQLAALIVRA